MKGCFKSKLIAKGNEVYIVVGLTQSLLGLPAIKALQLVTQPETYFVVYPSIFQGLGKLQQSYKIKLKDGTTPCALSTPHVPLPMREKVYGELVRIKNMDVITKVTEPKKWCSGMVVVPKANGDIRVCVDLTPLNESVIREHLQC